MINESNIFISVKLLQDLGFVFIILWETRSLANAKILQ
jgi:hypothetical protein